MGWRCRRVRRLLALYVGDDLTEPERRAAEAHVAACPNCRAYLASLERSRDSLLQCRTQTSGDETSPSLWPALKNRLQAAPPAAPRRNSWLPVGAMTAATVAIAVVLWNRPAASLPSVRSVPSSGASWIPRGVRSVEAINNDARGTPEFTPNSPNQQFQPPVRSFYLLESGSPSANVDEEL